MLLLCIVVATMFNSNGASAQGGRANAAAAQGTQEIAAGWTALAGGRAAEAERAATAMLRKNPRSHEALTLLVRARVTSGQPAGALDSYEQWLRSVTREDVFLLQPIATGILRTIAASAEQPAQTRALQLLAENGDPDAGARLTEVASAAAGGSIDADVALAKAGDARAVTRLERRLQVQGRDVSLAIDALRDAGAKGSAGAIAAMLDPARPAPTRMAAARALGKLGAEIAMTPLRNALQDPDGPVRVAATLALAQLGDEAALARVDEFANSPSGDLRVAAAEVRAAGNPHGAWVTTVTAALQDEDPLVRVHAAEVLVEHAADPSAGLEALMRSLSDPNPALRLAAASALDRIPPTALPSDLASLRQLLRDGSADVRASAAGAILRLAGGVD